MQIHVSELQIGDTVAEDIFNAAGLVILPAHTVVGPEEIEKLIQHRVDYVTITLRNHPSDASDPETHVHHSLKVIERHFEQTVQGFRELFQQAKENGKIDEHDVSRSFFPLMNRLGEKKDVVSVLLKLRSKDEYTFTHSVQVGVLSYYLSLWLGISEEKAQEIAVAGYLHDIGKCKIDENILMKPGRLTPEEFAIMKEHTIHGYSILKESFKHEIHPLVALQHHERINGTGYPHGAKGKEIHTAAKIVMVADIYSAMTSDRVYQKKRDLLTTLKELHHLSFEALDPIVTHVFIKNMIPHFIGKKVTLSNGQEGKIVMTNPMDFFHPLVLIEGRFVDLGKIPNLEIETIHI